LLAIVALFAFLATSRINISTARLCATANLTLGGVLGSRSNRIIIVNGGLDMAFRAAIRTRCGARGFSTIFL